MKNRYKKILAVLLAPVLILLFVAVIRDDYPKRGLDRDWERESISRYSIEEDVLGIQGTLEETGYVRYQDVPAPFMNLLNVDRGVLQKNSSVVKEGEYLDGYMHDETRFSTLYQRLNENTYFTMVEASVVHEYQNKYGGHCELSYNLQTNQFEGETINQLESCGFTGIRDVLSQIGAQFQKDLEKTGLKKWRRQAWDYELSCQGVRFCLTHADSETAQEEKFYLFPRLNPSMCYVPGGYEELVKQITAGGEYFLYSSAARGRMTALTFCRNNVFSVNYGWNRAKGMQGNDRRITFIFEGKTLKDYYISSRNSEPEPDETDKVFLKTYAGGLKKELGSVKRAAGSDLGNECLLRRTGS